jgi:hypothetical protein
MEGKQITLSLSIEDTNLILEALGNMPFVRVFVLINTLQQQAAAQIKPPDAPTS